MRFMRAQLIFMSLLVLAALISPVYAGTETLDIFGTNASNAQVNITKFGNQSINVSSWAIGNGVKTFTINVTNITDTFTITIHNITVGRVIDERFNGSSVSAIQADSTGTIVFAQVQTTGNKTYTLQPAVNVGGNNFTWAWVWNLTIGTDLDMHGKNITGVNKLSVNITNVTLLNATNIQGNGSEISNLNTSNLSSQPWVNKSGDTMTGQLRTTSSITNPNPNALYLGGFNSGLELAIGVFDGTIASINSVGVLFPVQATTALAPAYAAGGLYSDTTIGKLMVAESATGTWQAATSTYTVINVTQNYTVANFSMTMFTVHATSGTLNITIPAPSTVNKGIFYVIKKKDVSNNRVGINVSGGYGACCIDNASWANITTKDNSITVVSDGLTEWNII